MLFSSQGFLILTPWDFLRKYHDSTALIEIARVCFVRLPLLWLLSFCICIKYVYRLSGNEE